MRAIPNLSTLSPTSPTSPTSRRLVVASAASALLGLASHGAWAQATTPATAPKPAAAASASSVSVAQADTGGSVTVAQTSLGRITVSGSRDATTEGSGSYGSNAASSTSTPLGLTPRETPQSITIITRQRMDEMGLMTLADAMQATPGVYVNYSDTERISYNARGYAINNFQVDGMLNTFGGYLKSAGDNAVYDRIEVVRGATGLATGAGDPSATINQVRKRPTRTFQASLSGRIGTYDLQRAEADVSGPLAFDGAVRGRFVAAKQQAGSFRPLYRENRSVFYGILEADLGRATTLAVGHEWQKSDPRGVTWGTVPYWNADGSLANLPYDLNLSTPWASWNMDERKTFGTIEHRFNADWRLRGALTRSDRRQDGSLYFGYGGYPRADGSGITVAYGRFPVQEDMNVVDLNVDGAFRLFGRRHEVALGWGSSDRTTTSLSATYTAPNATYGTIPNWRTWTGEIPTFGSTLAATPASIGRIQQRAGYLATRINPSDALKVILGARYGEYTTTTRNFNTATGAPTTTTGYKNDGIVTPYAGVLFDVHPLWTVYASYTDIFQPQNFRDRNNEPLEPVVGASVEAGIKGELFDKRLNVSAAVFRSKKDNVAEIDDSVPPNSLPGNVQAYRSTGAGNVIDGIEFDATGQVTRSWNLSAGYTHVRSRDSKGNAINTVVPRNLFRLFTSYKLGGALEGVTVGGGVNFQGKFWNTAQKPTGAYNAAGAPVTALSRIEQKAVATVSLMAGYRFNENVSASINVNNLFDEHYANRVGFYNGIHYAEPRTVSAGLRVAF